MEGVRVAPQERNSLEISFLSLLQISPAELVQEVQRRITVQIVGVPVLQILKEIVDVARLPPQERVQRRVMW